MPITSRRQAFLEAIQSARRAYREGRLDAAFYQLENAHILGQTRTGEHALSHWWMLKVGWRRGNAREVFGQLVRLLASLLFSRLWVPPGNTGGADVSALKPMPIRDELKRYF